MSYLMANLWSLMIREDPEASGMGFPSLSIFIQRTGYSVAQRTLHSMSMVEERVVEIFGVTYEMVGVLWPVTTLKHNSYNLSVTL